MKISIIIPVYNEENTIEDCIFSLSKQSFKDFEIIVVDDGSSDATYEKLLKIQKFTENLIVIRQGRGGAGAARNLGAKRSIGDILVFVDADMTFEKDFLKKLAEPIVRGEALGTFSKDEYVSNWDNTWARCLNINEGWPSKKRHKANYPDQQLVFRAILKSEFDKVGGFTPGGYDDDWSLSKKLGYQAVATSGAVFYHKNPDNPKDVFSQGRWSGKRNYKFGIIGLIVGLLRSSFPVSLYIGIVKSLSSKTPKFLIFKIVFDFGVFIGILEKLFFGKTVKE